MDVSTDICFSVRDKYYVNQPYYKTVEAIRNTIINFITSDSNEQIKTLTKSWKMNLVKQLIKLPCHAMVLWPKVNMYVSVYYLLMTDYQLQPIFKKVHKYCKVKYLCDGDDDAFDIYFRADYRYIPLLYKLKIPLNNKAVVNNLSNMVSCGNINTIKALIKHVKSIRGIIPDVISHMDDILNVQNIMLIGYGHAHTEEESVVKQRETRAINSKILDILFDQVNQDDLDASLWTVARYHYEIGLLRCLKNKRVAGCKPLPGLDDIDESICAHLRWIYNEVRLHEAMNVISESV